MRIPYWRVYLDEAGEGGTAASGGGAGAPAGEGTVTLPAADAPLDPGAPAPQKPVSTEGMLAAIDKGLAYEPGKDQKVEGAAAADGKQAKPPAGEKPEETASRVQKEADAKARTELETKAAAGDAQAKADLEKLKKADAAEAAKPKDLKALELNDADKKAMGAKTQQRFNEVLGIAKTERAAREQAEARVASLDGARTSLLSVLKETNTSNEDLGQLLEFNRLVKSGQPADLEQALAVMDTQRLSILKALGREGQGYDPLKEFPDLAQQVEDNRITKAAALELAGNRKREALARSNTERGERSRQQQQQNAEQRKQANEKGLNEIETWSVGLQRTDIDFKAKEAILLPKIDQIVATYPPHLWLPTIKQVYETIVVPKGPAELPKVGDTPLRPSGARAGNAAPTSMAEAIDQALGYASK